jgi:hypothetical protein
VKGYYCLTGRPEFGEIERDTERERETERESELDIRERACHRREGCPRGGRGASRWYSDGKREREH